MSGEALQATGHLRLRTNYGVDSRKAPRQGRAARRNCNTRDGRDGGICDVDYSTAVYTVRRWPGLIRFECNRFHCLIAVTLVSNNRAIDDNVSPRLTR